jgi:molecular chaperone GrpE
MEEANDKTKKEAADIPEANISEIERLKESLAACEKMRDDYLAGWQRQKADFLNYQKDIIKRTEEIIKFANEDLIKDVLIVLDSFDISLNSLKMEKLAEAEKRMAQGVELIKCQLEDVLRKRGLVVIETRNQKFNPEFHEVFEEVDGDGEEGTIVEEAIKGYQLNGKVIRPAKVKIIKHK